LKLLLLYFTLVFGGGENRASLHLYQGCLAVAGSVKGRNDCFIFDFEGAWSHFIRKLSGMLKRKLEERKLTPEKIYRKLKVFSFPVAERAELLRQRKI